MTLAMAIDSATYRVMKKW